MRWRSFLGVGIGGNKTRTLLKIRIEDKRLYRSYTLEEIAKAQE